MLVAAFEQLAGEAELVAVGEPGHDARAQRLDLSERLGGAGALGLPGGAVGSDLERLEVALEGSGENRAVRARDAASLESGIVMGASFHRRRSAATTTQTTTPRTANAVRSPQASASAPIGRPMRPKPAKESMVRDITRPT